ncbi:hypothetical protein [Lysinibacillus sp. FSL M8-0134]|uniref:hypothetical protein n=1 Tax=Lysinibacillus sp. FSL M8-0134 TaxID=2921717 RepID=UPI003119DAA5
MQVIIKSVPPLLGATLSGLIALLVYYLNKQKEIGVKKASSYMALRMIQLELTENYKVLAELKNAFEKTNLDSLTEMLSDDPKLGNVELKEMFIVIQSKFTLEITDKLFSNLLDSDYLSVAKDIKSIRSLINMLKLINTDISSKENKRALLQMIETTVNGVSPLKHTQTLDTTIINKEYLKNLLKTDIQLWQIFSVIFILIVTILFFSPSIK